MLEADLDQKIASQADETVKICVDNSTRMVTVLISGRERAISK
jgi:hypothetical protein